MAGSRAPSRASSRANSRTSQSPTPGPKTRARTRDEGTASIVKDTRELPSLSNKMSNAYGGAGRAALPEHLSAITDANDLGELLEAKTQAADLNIGQEEPQQQQAKSSGVARGKKGLTRSDKNLPPTIPEEEEEINTEGVHAGDVGNDTTQIGNGKSFTREQHITRGHAAKLRTSSNANTHEDTNETPVSERTSDHDKVTVPARESKSELVPGHLSFWHRSAICLFLLLGLFAAFYTSTNISGIDGNQTSLSGRVQYLTWKIKSYGTWTLTRRAYDISYELETKNADEHEASLAELRKILPDHVLFPTDPSTGLLIVPNAFWHAVAEKAAYNLGFTTEQKLWDSYMLHNQERLQEIAETSAGKALNTTLGHNPILNSHDVVRLVQQNNGLFKTYLDSGLAQAERRQKVYYNGLLQEDLNRHLNDRLSQLPWEEIYGLSRSMIVQNLADQAHELNYFAADLGAAVDLRFTSPTLLHDEKNLMTEFFSRFKTVYHESHNPPAKILSEWRGAADCWCAAPSHIGYRKGPQDFYVLPANQDKYHAKAQIAILTPHLLIPNRLTIEHIHKDATLDPLSAPKEIELWIAIPNVFTRETIWEAARRYFPSEERKPYHLNESEHAGLPQEYIRVGRFEYDLNAENHIQAFDIPLDLVHEFGERAATNAVVVRVLSSWGQPYTCLYRVRLTGKAPQQLLDRRRLLADPIAKDWQLGEWFTAAP